MEEEFKNGTLNEGLELKKRDKIEKPSVLLQDSLSSLDKFDGFQLLKDLIRRVENMVQRHKAVNNIFLPDSAYTDTREKLKNELELWVSILEDKGTDPMAIIELCKAKCDKAEQNLKSNLFNIHEEIKNLEISYRSLDSFFANAGQGKIDCITIMNVNKDNLGDNDSEDIFAIREELEKYCNYLFLKNNYSLLVVPGYLGDADTIRIWADIAYRNKVIMLTDFKDSLNFELLKEELDDANLQGQDAKLANIVMTCNYILGRKKSELANEDDDVYLPASAAIAGRMTNTDEIVIAQGAAGMKYGTLSNVKGARLDLCKSEIEALIDLGVIPIVEEDGRTMAFSNRTLYKGTTIGLQEYPIVRVLDWIGKVFLHFLCDYAFILWNSQVKSELQQAIHDFLSDYKGPEKLIENYNLKGINQDFQTKDISIQVELKPFFAAKNIFLELTGHYGPAEMEWDQNVK